MILHFLSTHKHRLVFILESSCNNFPGYLEIFYHNNWGFVCDEEWKLEEANLVCKQLGFARGVRSTTQGLVHGPVDESRKITERIDCQGSEDALQKCRIRYVCIHQTCFCQRVRLSCFGELPDMVLPKIAQKSQN